MAQTSGIPLASGGQVLVTDSELRVLAPNGDVQRFHALAAVTNVETSGSVTSIAFRSGPAVTLGMASEADATTLHDQLMTRLNQPLHAPTPTSASRLHVKTYDKELHFIHDAAAMDAAGWQVVSSTTFQPRSGWARILISLGWLALVYPPKPQLVVTYARLALEPPPA